MAYNGWMVELIFTVLAVFIILIASEAWWRKRVVHGEFSRKFVHITVGSFVAFWPFYLSWGQIELLSAAFLVVVFISKQLDIFHAVHTVQRPTWGELYFAAAVGLTVLLTHNKWIYAAAILQMSLADGFAAVIGSAYGGRNKYTVFGHTKSLLGTATFFVISAGILIALNSYMPEPLGLGLIIAASGLAAFIENVGVMGLDNLLVPVLIALILVNG